MPIYEYYCQKCDEVHSVIQKLSDRPLQSCPNCESPVEKIISRPSPLATQRGGGELRQEAVKPAASTPTKTSSLGCHGGQCRKKHGIV